jgi:hypothetical protein
MALTRYGSRALLVQRATSACGNLGGYLLESLLSLIRSHAARPMVVCPWRLVMDMVSLEADIQFGHGRDDSRWGRRL